MHWPVAAARRCREGRRTDLVWAGSFFLDVSKMSGCFDGLEAADDIVSWKNSARSRIMPLEIRDGT